jgi:hypothetical protein
MRFVKSAIVLFFSLLAAFAVDGIRSNAQANVTENSSTYIYVDANLGSDSNVGARSTPFKTIQAATNKANTYNQQGTAVRVIVNPGVYREAVTIGSYKATSATLIIQAAIAGTAIIDGANVLTGWTQQNSTTYQTTWPYSLASCAVPSGWPAFAPVVQRAEMVFVNGVALTEVMSGNDLKPGTFYVNDQDHLIYVAPPAGTRMTTAAVEAAVRPQTLSLGSRTNVVLRGLVFRHAANCFNTSSATINSSNNVLIDSVQALWNNWGGLGINSSSNVTVQNSVASYNGGVGFMGNKDQNALYKFNQSDYNNWRGAQGAFYDWAMGGAKFAKMRNATVQNHFSYNNQAEGLWFDTDNKNIVIDDATLAGNVQAALQLERNEGPITVENSHLCSSGQGVNVLTSPNLTVKNNTFYNNSGTNKYQAEIFIAGQPGGMIITDWQTGQDYDLFTTGMVLSGNSFENAAAGQLVFGTYLSGTDWTQFASTLKASGNRWYDPLTANSFKVPNSKIVNLSGWQGAVQTDYTSSWQLPTTSPVGACTPPAPSFTDFSVNLDANTYAMSAGMVIATARVNSFGYGTVNLQVSGLPIGVTAKLSQTSLVSGVVTFTLTAAKTAVTQTVPITLWATSGSRVHSVTFIVKVSAT